MTEVLFRPFKLSKWLSLGFIALIASGGGPNGNFNWPRDGKPTPPAELLAWVARYWPFLVVGAILLIFLVLLIMWIVSVFRLIYVNDVASNSGAIREPFARLKGLGTSYFLWQIVFGLVVVAVLVAFVGLPIVLAVLAGKSGRGPTVILAVLWAIGVGVPIALLSTLVDVFTRHFVLPVMYVRRVGILRAWGIFWPILKANAGQMVLYVLIRIGLAIIIGLVGIAAFVTVLMVAMIPLGALVLVGYLVGTALGLSWTLPVIVSVAGFALMAVLGLVYLSSCVVQPADVFAQAYPLVILGQADPSLATIPVETPPAAESPGV